MQVTDKTFMQLFKEVLASGIPWRIMLCCFLIGFAIGAVLVWLYFEKLRYYNLIKELEQEKTKLTQAEHERDEYKKKYEDLKNRTKYLQDAEYARLATEPDVVLLPPDED